MRSSKKFSLIISILLIVTFCSCKRKESLLVKPLPVLGEKRGNILTGPSFLNDPVRFVWGASVIKGKDNKYHMLYSTWECGDSVPKFADSWLLNSKIAYAVSDYPDRDFMFRKIVLTGRGLDGDSTAWDAQSVHNPHIKRFNDKYYLYYTGSMDPGVQPVGSKDEYVNKRNRVQQSQCIGVIEFKSFKDLINGDFQRPDSPLLSPRTRVKPDNIIRPSPENTEPKPDNIIVVNPSVVKRPSDGKYLLYFKGNLYEPNWKGVHGVAIGDSPSGPFYATDNYVFDIRNDDGSIASGEDPFVWYHSDYKKFYAILKDFTGKITNIEPGLAILKSDDGMIWTKLDDPFFMKKVIILNTGDTVLVNHLERPQLLIDDHGNPVVFYGACSLINISQSTGGESFNVHIPLKTE